MERHGDKQRPRESLIAMLRRHAGEIRGEVSDVVGRAATDETAGPARRFEVFLFIVVMLYVAVIVAFVPWLSTMWFATLAGAALLGWVATTIATRAGVYGDRAPSRRR